MGVSVLRQELQLLPQSTGDEATQQWLLYDPLRESYFQLGMVEVEILRLLQRIKPEQFDAEAVVQSVSDQLGQGKMPQVESFLEFLRDNALLRSWEPVHRQRLQQQRQAEKPGLLRSLVRNYLFWRLPLFNPDRFLSALLPWLRWLFCRQAAWGMLLIFMLGGFLSLRQLDSFTHTLVDLLTPQGLAVFALSLLGVKVLHEFGHGIVAKHFGCRVPQMGVALMVFWPVLYTDTTDAWRLQNKSKRLWIGAAGILTELGVGVICLLLWSLLPDGPLRSACFMLATTTWVMTLLVNLNPLMRFDGYFLLADWMGVSNLQQRSFALGRWWLRTRLWGMQLAPPEYPSRRLILFAYATWLYRFLLLLGIALIIYQLFFKVLGLLLVALHLGRSLLAPLLGELRWLIQHRQQQRRPVRLLLVLGAIVALLIWLASPGRSVLMISGQLESDRSQTLFAEVDGRVAEVPKKDGFQQGELIYRLEVPDLSYRLSETDRELAVLEWQLSHQSVGQGYLQPLQRVQTELLSVREKKQALLEQDSKSQVKAPFSGRLADRDWQLQTGDWISKGTPLAVLVSDQAARVEAYVSERQLEYLSEGDQGLFYPEGGSSDALAVVLESVDQAALVTLQSPYQASIHGGQLEVNHASNGQLVPKGTHYRVWFSVEGTAGQRVLRGEVRLETETRSYLAEIWRHVVGVWRREAGF